MLSSRLFEDVDDDDAVANRKKNARRNSIEKKTREFIETNLKKSIHEMMSTSFKYIPKEEH